MRPGDKELAKSLATSLKKFSKEIELLGIVDPDHFNCLIEQMIDSIRRIRYVRLISSKRHSDVNLNGKSDLFDPLKGAVNMYRENKVDEAFWLVFLATHFGKHLSSGWSLTKTLYCADSDKPYWTWERTIKDHEAILEWLDSNEVRLKDAGKFGNHRKYENLSAYKSRGTGAAILSYIDWIGNSHEAKIQKSLETVDNDPLKLFGALYDSMSEVVTFGRTAKFDYLTMLGKMSIINTEPQSPYLRGATGPLRGARLLVGGSVDANISVDDLEELSTELSSALNLDFGMQVIEDSLCNWQKNPSSFRHFAG